MTTSPDDTTPDARKRAERLSASRAALVARLDTPMLSGTLPATIELRPKRDLGRRTCIALGLAGVSFAVLLAFAWNEGLLDRADDEPLAEYLGYVFELAQSEWLLVPVLCLVAAAVFHRMGGDRPDWVRITLSMEEARIEEPGGVLNVPIADFTAVTLRTRAGFSIKLTNQTSTNVQRGILPGQQSAVLERDTLWWVELVHPDPERSVPVWASYSPNAETAGRRVAVSLADRLELPIDLPDRATATG